MIRRLAPPLILVCALTFAASVFNSRLRGAGALLAAANPRIASMQLIQTSGARPKWSPLGDRFVFDRRSTTDGYYDLFISDRNGQIVASLTSGRPITQRHNGNGIYRWNADGIVFISEVPEHYNDWGSAYGQVPFTEPGVGLFNNLWATDGWNFWQLTNIPIKMASDDGIAPFATVNPHFAPGNSMLVWTERYSDGGTNNWGLWRLKAADYAVGPNGPAISNERVLFTPSVGTYVTAMAFLGRRYLLVAGNLDGQQEYGMDLYILSLDTGTILRNLTNTPTFWEEGSCVAPSGRIVYMTNADSRYTLDLTKTWVGQPIERDYWMMNPDGLNKERLTYFNDPTAPEYQGWRSVTVVCDISPDGKTMAATVGRDYGDDTAAWVWWQIWLIEFKDPI